MRVYEVSTLMTFLLFINNVTERDKRNPAQTQGQDYFTRTSNLSQILPSLKDKILSSVLYTKVIYKIPAFSVRLRLNLLMGSAVAEYQHRNGHQILFENYFLEMCAKQSKTQDDNRTKRQQCDEGYLLLSVWMKALTPTNLICLRQAITSTTDLIVQCTIATYLDWVTRNKKNNKKALELAENMIAENLEVQINKMFITKEILLQLNAIAYQTLQKFQTWIDRQKNRNFQRTIYIEMKNTSFQNWNVIEEIIAKLYKLLTNGIVIYLAATGVGSFIIVKVN